MRRLLVSILVLVGTTASVPAQDLKLPMKEGSVKFAVIGDTGTGDQHQLDIAKQLATYRGKFPFDFVIMMGDNLYGSNGPKDYEKKFALPYKPLTDAGVKFYASLGNHDDPNIERLYKPFNMNGQRYHTFKKGDVQFYALDSTYMDPQQLKWFEQNLQSSSAKWKICFF